jgi:long-subunit fatty acid transport protein
MRPHALAAGLLVIGLLPRPAVAGGLDLPIVYTARQAGMGGTAIAGVNDASAVLHDPAGLSGVRGLQALGNLTLVLSDLETSPGYPNQNVQTGNTLGPAPFVAAAYRINRYVAVGLGAYPVGAVSGTFHYTDVNGIPTLNSQDTLAFEVSPAVAVTPVKELSLGVGYRVTIIQFKRHLGGEKNPVLVDVDSLGANFAGFRLGAQWHPLRELSLGLVYRPPVTVTTSADSGHLLGLAASNIQATLTFPGKIGAGARLDLESFSVAADYEFVWNSQFKTIHLGGNLPGQAPISTDFIFNWSDSSTVKLGAEYRPTPKIALRGGYAWDGPFANLHYPDTFAQPTADGHYVTLGAGYRGESWAVNFALSLRPDETTVIRAQDIASAAECRFCTYAGTYSSRLEMALLDFSKDFDL